VSIEPALKDIGGTGVKDESIFKGFKIVRTLMEHEFPLLLSAKSPIGENWLFNWCDSVEEPPITRWMAFKIDNEKLHSLELGNMSLREAITLSNDQIFIFDAKDVFKPNAIRRTTPEQLSNYIPTDDISIYGKTLRPESVNSDKFNLSLHVFSRFISNGQIPFPIMSELEDRIQHYLRFAAHSINRTPSGRVSTSVKDWATMRLAGIAAGSFKMECVSNTIDPNQNAILSKACEALMKLSEGNTDVDSIRHDIGEDGIFLAFLLAQFVAKSDISMSISWLSEENSKGYLAIDKRRAEKFLRSHESFKERQKMNVITLKLTDEEADPIRKEIRGTGGHQSLLRALQSKLTKQNTIELTPEEIEKILRYGMNYGSGGFQNRIVGIAKALKRVDVSFHSAFAGRIRSAESED
jgi:hypothetical protein